MIFIRREHPSGRGLPLGLALLLTLCSAGCGESNPSHSTSSGDAHSGDGFAFEDDGTEILLAAPEAELPAALKDNVRRRDPAFDQWQSEVLHELTKPVLDDFLSCLLDPEGEADFDDVLAVRYEGTTVLRPDPLVKVFDDGVSLVLEPEVVGRDLRLGRDALEEAAAGLRDAFEGAVPDWHFKVVHVEESEERAFSTTALVWVHGELDGRHVQQNMVWQQEWRQQSEDEVRLASNRLESFEEVWTLRPLLSELTDHLFSEVRAFETEFLHGIEHYQNRTDRLIGNSFLGMQGIAVADVDGNGLEDLFISQQGGLPNRLFLHQPDGTLRDGSGTSRLGFLENTRGALFVDLDNDGDQDFLAGVGPNLLGATNDGKGVFGEFRFWRSDKPGDIYSLSAADPDNDGDLDIFACRYAENGVLYGVPTPYHDANNGATNIFWRQEGRDFVDATEEVGFDANNRKYSLASVWEDFDADGDLDLYVANDFGRNNLWRNDGGFFTDIAEESGADDMSAGMGVSVSDVDLDGSTDIYVTNMFSSAGLRIVPQTDKFMDGENVEVHGAYKRHARGNTLLANRGDGTFEDVTEEARVDVGGWAWGSKFFDLNNDGLEDIYSPNGFVTNRETDDL